jgi:hypothetical protein
MWDTRAALARSRRAVLAKEGDTVTGLAVQTPAGQGDDAKGQQAEYGRSFGCPEPAPRLRTAIGCLTRATLFRRDTIPPHSFQRSSSHWTVPNSDQDFVPFSDQSDKQRPA